MITRSMTSKILVFSCILCAFLVTGCGRDASRLGGKEYRQVIEVPNMECLLNISMRPEKGATVKDITYKATDGYYYTAEYKDITFFSGGLIRWVPATEESSVVRSRVFSRIFSTAVNLQLPSDCVEIYGVTLVNTKSGTAKNLTYLSTDGTIYVKEYRDGMVSRNFEGWLEIKAVQK